MKQLLRELCPPLIWRTLQRLRSHLPAGATQGSPPGQQDLDVYWDPQMAQILEHWGEGNAWSEIQLLLAARRGRVLDIACGTGKVMSLLGGFAHLEVHGCDISDMLLGKAVERGIAQDRVRVADATAMAYAAGSFDLGYSIGSLEHFTEEGIQRFLAECHRVVNGATFHMVPVSRSGRDEGWIKTFQSYHNNSAQWWQARCEARYAHVQILDSSWSDRISVGKWLVCEKDR